MVQYLPRAIDTFVAEALASMGGVLIEGPRACGKTSTGLHHAASSVRLDRSPELITLAELDPEALLTGATPRLIDEWQLAPSLWNVIRHTIDDRQRAGQFIVSGSATPADDITRHSGAGRVARIRMRPMALAESGRSTGEVSLASLMAGLQVVTGTSGLTYADIAAEAVRGGWPALINGSLNAASLFARSYCDDLYSTDIPEAIGVRHEPVRLRRLMAALARNVSTEVTLAKLAADVGADGRTADPRTMRTYLDALARVFALDELPAWSVSLRSRSRSRLRTSAKVHLADPSLACASLGVGPDRLARDPEFFGSVFESMVVRDVRAYASARGGQTYHYRDNTGLEIDVVVEYPDGSWGAVEAKLGGSRITQAEQSLRRLRDERVDVSRVGQPAFLAVLTATQHAYTLPSGVHVVPLGVLGA